MWYKSSVEHCFLLAVDVELFRLLLHALQLQDVVDGHLLKMLAALCRLVLTIHSQNHTKNTIECELLPELAVLTL